MGGTRGIDVDLAAESTTTTTTKNTPLRDEIRLVRRMKNREKGFKKLLESAGLDDAA